MELTLTEAAANKVSSLLEEESDSTLNLRVAVTQTGCSGLSYLFTFDPAMAPDDVVVDTNGVKMVVDPASYAYLEGSAVDYVEGEGGASFTVANPNAQSTCGCGSSFSI